MLCPAAKLEQRKSSKDSILYFVRIPTKQLSFAPNNLPGVQYL